MSFHADTFITTPAGYKRIVDFNPGDTIFNLSSKQTYTVLAVEEEEVNFYFTISVPHLKPLLCSPNQFILSSDGNVRASDICVNCKLLTALGVRFPTTVKPVMSPQKFYKLRIDHTNPIYLANGIYVAERS